MKLNSKKAVKKWVESETKRIERRINDCMNIQELVSLGGSLLTLEKLGKML